LLLDDHSELAADVSEILTRELGVKVTVAGDAATGLPLAGAQCFDVVLVDVCLPDASGVELIAPLKEACPRCEIVLLTGSASVESVIDALHAGACGFVLKSYRPEQLVKTVAQALEKAALRREREVYERRYHALVNAADVLVVGLRPAGSVAFFNPKLADLLGVDPAWALGKPFVLSWVDADDARRFESAMASVLEGEPVQELEIGMPDGEGAVRRVRWHLSGARESGTGGVDHVYGIGVDVTARRALERRAASAEALNAMAPLALGLAHEIRNPLNAAVLELHLLARGIARLEQPSVREPMRRRVHVVESEIRRLERLLTEFLELARPRPPEHEALDLGQVIAEVVELESQATKRSGVQVEQHLERGARVVGDHEKLKQVVLNLVVNALDAMPEGGRLDLRLGVEAEDVVLRVADTGKGIDPRILAEVFDPFFTTKPAGTGLGLAIVRRIVDQHGGRVSLSSTPGEGTTAIVRLPSAGASESSSASS
jgi:PAS domain S-box-containing protein